MGKFCKHPEEMKFSLLLGTIGRMHARRADRFMERFGLFRGQAILLKILSDENGLTHSEIAETLEISPAAATKVIKRMEALGYVRRAPDPSDERISRVFLQEEGWAVIRQIETAFEQIDEMLLSRLTSDEQGALVELLRKVYAGLLESEPEAQAGRF